MSSTTIPVTRMAIVVRSQPFHSLRMMPHTLLKTTFSAMRMQNESVVSTGEEVRKPLPKESPKNWLYHSAPARKQKKRLLPHTFPLP